MAINQAEKIQNVIELLFERENDFEAAARDYADKEAAYRLKKASEFLIAEGTVAEREAVAAKKAWEAHKQKLASEAVLSIAKEKLLDARAALSARQSILSAESKVHSATANLTT